MATLSLPHASLLSLLVLALALATSFTPTTSTHDNEKHAYYSHPLPYTSPSSAPAPAAAPSHHHHHHHHTLSPSSAPAVSPTHHHHHHHSPSPTSAPGPAVHHHHHQSHSPSAAPSHSPVKSPPSYPPTKAPVVAPAHPPTHAPHIMPPRKLVAVEGVVYCKNCSYSGVDTLTGASPLAGATVELRCRNTQYMIKKTSTTDKNGFFFLQAPKYITTYGAHKCKVFLLEEPNKNSGPCSHATDLNGGVSGAFLFFDKKSAPPSKALPYSVYSVGPFAFEPTKCYKH